jgi:hypothetical protein
MGPDPRKTLAEILRATLSLVDRYQVSEPEVLEAKLSLRRAIEALNRPTGGDSCVSRSD